MVVVHLAGWLAGWPERSLLRDLPEPTMRADLVYVGRSVKKRGIQPVTPVSPARKHGHVARKCTEGPRVSLFMVHYGGEDTGGGDAAGEGANGDGDEPPPPPPTHTWQ